MHNYRAFGLHISSELEFKELTPLDHVVDSPDLEFRLKDFGCEIPEMGAQPEFDFEDEIVCQMIWPGMVCARIVGPNLIEVQLYPGVLERLIPFPLLGPVLGWALHLRGYFVLHASAVAWQGRTIVLLGDKGAGKSTTATAFLRAGANLLTDDLLAIDMINFERPTIMPAYGQIKLVTETSKQISPPDSEELPLVWDNFPKRQYRVSDMQQTPMPCDYVFVLNRTENDLSIDWLDGIQALAHLMRFSYNIRFTEAPDRLQRPDRHLKYCASVAKSASVGRLNVPHDLRRLDDAIAFVSETLLSPGQ